MLVVTPGNEPLELGLTTEIAARLADVRFEGPDFLKTDTYRNPAQSGYYDLVIYDRCSPEAMPQANTLMIAALPPGDAWSAEASVDVPQIIDIERSHPLLQLIEMVEVRIVEATPLVAPSGATSLIDTDRAGVVFAIAPREAFEDAVLGFSLVTAEGLNTDWPMKLSFPLFLFNVIEYLGGVRDPLVAGTVAPGSSVKLETEGAGEELEVQKPDDARVTVLRSDFGTYHFAETDELGVYAVSAGDEKKLPSTSPSTFSIPRKAIFACPRRIRLRSETSTLLVSAAEQVARHQGWKILVLLALVVLLVEWYIYNRRVYL
ncbi:MAG: hypothetical protein R3C10_09350 [Pirellulales bacterium]